MSSHKIKYLLYYESLTCVRLKLQGCHFKYNTFLTYAFHIIVTLTSSNKRKTEQQINKEFVSHCYIYT